MTATAVCDAVTYQATRDADYDMEVRCTEIATVTVALSDGRSHPRCSQHVPARSHVACPCGHPVAEHYANGCRWCRCQTPGPHPEERIVLDDGCVNGHSPELFSCSLGVDWP